MSQYFLQNVETMFRWHGFDIWHLGTEINILEQVEQDDKVLLKGFVANSVLLPGPGNMYFMYSVIARTASHSASYFIYISTT